MSIIDHAYLPEVESGHPAARVIELVRAHARQVHPLPAGDAAARAAAVVEEVAMLNRA